MSSVEILSKLTTAVATSILTNQDVRKHVSNLSINMPTDYDESKEDLSISVYVAAVERDTAQAEEPINPAPKPAAPAPAAPPHKETCASCRKTCSACYTY